MTMKTVTSAALGCAIAFSGCGGGSSASEPASMTGQFLDSAVQGLSYSCSSDANGTTDADGAFTCNTGDTVTFSLNGYTLGSVRADAFITPESLYPGDAAKATDVAQLLQTLDSDGNPNNGITIDSRSDAYRALAGVDVAVGQADFDSAMASYIGVALVDEATANAHMAMTVRNVENGAGRVTENSIVAVMKHVSPSLCQVQDPYTMEYEGYSDYADFLEAGGSVGLHYYSGAKRCDDYVSAAFCQEQDFADMGGGMSGTGSCVQVVTFPDGTAGTDDNGVDTGDGSTQNSGGLAWFASSTELTSPVNALAACDAKGARLPTAQELRDAFQAGLEGFGISPEYNDENPYISADTVTDNMLRYKIVVYRTGWDYSDPDMLKYTYGDNAGEYQSNAGYVRCVK